jgi:hypothetical protein
MHRASISPPRSNLAVLLATAGLVAICVPALGADIAQPSTGEQAVQATSFLLVAGTTGGEFPATVEKPTTSLQLLQNLKLALQNDLLLRRDFYAAESLTRFFGVEEASSGVGENNPNDIWVRAKTFGYAVKSAKNDEYVFSGISFSAGLKSKEVGKSSSFVVLAFGLGGPSFDDMEKVFGKGWVPDKTAPLHGPPPPPTAPHGNERLTYMLDDSAVERRLFIQFHGNGLIFLAHLSEETK